jgi:hypothetical protein
LAAAASGNTTTLLNGANQMNQEGQDMATMLRNKAGDNQAMITMAETISGDHKANQEAVKALADSRKITLKDYKKNNAANDQMSKLNGAEFNSAFFAMTIRDHNGAIETFKTQLAAAAGENRRTVDKTRPLLLAPAGGEPPHTAAVCRHAAEDRGVAGTGGIGGTLIAEKLGRREAERGAVRRESPARVAELSWKASGTACSGPPLPPRGATTVRLAPS